MLRALGSGLIMDFALYANIKLLPQSYDKALDPLWNQWFFSTSVSYEGILGHYKSVLILLTSLRFFFFCYPKDIMLQSVQIIVLSITSAGILPRNY